MREAKPRYAYLDFIRIAAVFLVIVNHTNSDVFEAAVPADITWWASIVWYYFSKIGVPLFVMISGACLLPKVDTYKSAFKRFARIGIVLVLFSYPYFLADVLQSYGGVKDALNFPGFIKSIWQAPITDSFWYLYFYLGLMLMLPWLQRLVNTMEKRDLKYFILLSLLFGAVWPLITHYVPKLSLSGYFDMPLFAIYLGIFFLGHYIHTYMDMLNKPIGIAVIVVSLAASTLLTYGEYLTVNGVGKYWFMDERTAPSIFIVLCAAAVMLLVKGVLQTPSEQTKHRLQTLGGCAFGIYLIQDYLIERTRYTVFTLLSQTINPLVVALGWEIAVFAAALLVIWLARKIPGVKKLI